MNLKKFSTIFIVLILSSSFVAAIDRYGDLKGTVTFEDGSGMPGVLVSIRGKALMGIKTAITDAKGRYMIRDVNTGADYQVTFELEGFKKIVKDKIRIELGKTTTVDAVLPPGSITEEVVVVATVPIIDKSSSTSQINLSDEDVQNLPTDRRYLTIMEMMPTVFKAPNPEVGGGSQYDNVYQFDGMDSTDPTTKTYAFNMNFDDFEEMQVITSGAPAEYGRGSAIINLVTKSGSNEFHGTARIQMSDVDWNAKAQGDRYFFRGRTLYRNEVRPSISGGGPIIKDHLWFYGAYERINVWRPGTYYQDFNDWITDFTPTQTKFWDKGNLANAKLSMRFGRLSGMFQWAQDPSYQPADGHGNLTPSADFEYWFGGFHIFSELSFTLGPNTYLLGGVGLKREKFNYNRSPHEEGNICYQRGDIYYGSSLYLYESTRYHDQYKLEISHIADTKNLGYHDLKAGIEYLHIHSGSLWLSYPGGEYILLNYDAAATPMERRIYDPAIPPSGMSYNDLWTFFIQDKWEITPNLSLNLGLRTEMGTWKNHEKDTILDYGIGKSLAPRLGAVYNIGNNKFHINAGRYVDIQAPGIVTDFQPDIFGRTEYLYLGEYYTNPETGNPYDTWTLVDVRRPSTEITSTLADDLGPQYMDELGYGYERAIGTDFSISIAALHRRFKNSVQKYDPNFIGIYHYANEKNWSDGNENWGNTYKKYNGLVLSVKKNLGDDKYQFFASYTLSKTSGFWDGRWTGDWGTSPFTWVNSLGSVGLDIRHLIKFNGSLILPFDIMFGTSFYWASGIPYHTIARAMHTNNRWYLYNLEPPGSQRYPATWRLDFRFEKRLQIKNLFAISVYADVFNILNNQIEVSRVTNIGRIALNGPIGTTDYTILTPNLTFGQWTEWFPPTSIFLGAKIEW